MRPVCLAFLLVCAGTAAAPGESPSETTDFIRFVEGDSEDTLQTALVRYRREDGVQVDLVGAVHVADLAYYEELNRRFSEYDAVLYEMVGGPHSGKSANEETAAKNRLEWVAKLQDTLCRSLALESQLDCIHYGALNFVHADLTAEAFQASQKERKESFFGLWLKAMQAQQASVGGRPQPGLATLVRILLSGDSATEMKRLIGREFDNLEPLLAGVEAGGGTSIIGERNRHALQVLESEVKSGHRHLAIFYGAAHLPDMETRLLAMGFRLVHIEYLSAWRLQDRKS